MAVRTSNLVRLFTWAAIALLPNFGRAGVLLHTSEVTSSFSAPDWALTGFTAFQLDVSTEDGDFISAIDVKLGGPFHQRFVKTNFHGGPPDPTPMGPPSNGRADSHLTLPMGALIGAAPTEDNNVERSPLPDLGLILEYGIGSYMAGTWSIPGDHQSSTTSLAYVVLPDDRINELTYDIAVATRSGARFDLTQGIAPNPQPEPNPGPDPIPFPIPGVYATAERITTEFDSPEEQLTGFVAYQLTAKAPAGVRFAAVDIHINGPLHQRWSDIDLDGVADPSPLGDPADGRGDSHATPPKDAILLLRDDVVGEDNNKSASPLSDGEFDYGIGSTLDAIWGIPNYQQTNEAELAYLVLPEDFDPSLLDIQIDVAVSSQHNLSLIKQFTTDDFFPPSSPENTVPEPTCLMLWFFALLPRGCRRRT